MCQRNIRVREEEKERAKKSIYFFFKTWVSERIHGMGKKNEKPLHLEYWSRKLGRKNKNSTFRLRWEEMEKRRKENRTLWGSNSLQQLIMRGKEITTKYGFFIGRKIFFKLLPRRSLVRSKGHTFHDVNEFYFLFFPFSTNSRRLND